MDEPRAVAPMQVHWFSADASILDDPEVDHKAGFVFLILSHMVAEAARRKGSPGPHPIATDSLIEKLRAQKQGRMSVKAIRSHLDLLHRRGWVVVLPRLAGDPEMVRLAHEGPHS